MDAPLQVAPFRVQWRASAADPWSNAAVRDTYELAVEKARALQEELGGQARILEQHVIEFVREIAA